MSKKKTEKQITKMFEREYVKLCEKYGRRIQGYPSFVQDNEGTFRIVSGHTIAVYENNPPKEEDTK